MSCSEPIGFKGSLKINGSSLPYTSANISNTLELYSPNLIGYSKTDYTKRSQYNFVKSRSYVKGIISTEIFNSGTYGSAIADLITSAIQYKSIDVDFSSGGSTAISLPKDGVCYCSGFQLSGNNGGVSSANFSIIASDFDEGGSLVSSLQFESVGTTDDQNPVPWYFTNFSVSGSGDDGDINQYEMDWSLSFSSPEDLIYALNGETSPVDIRLGSYIVNGSFSYLSPSGSYPTLSDGCTGTLDLSVLTLHFPYLVFTDQNAPTKDLNSVVVKTCNFTSFGYNSNPSIYI